MIDLLDPVLHASGEVDRALRALPPVAWSSGRRGPGYWSITGHPELVEAARDPATFSSHWGTRPEVRRSPDAPRRLHSLDPPAHGALRTRMAARFAVTPAIADIVDDAFAAFAGGEAMAGLVIPIASRVLGAWLGVDAAALHARVMQVHAAGAALVDTATRDPQRSVRAREAAAAEAALTALVGTEDVLFAEALPSLIDALGSALVDLVTHPGLLAHPGLVASPALVEELLRRASPSTQFARQATRDIVLGDARIRAGDQVVLWFWAANRDPRVFREPDALIADRAPNPHVAFGFGPHRCLGAQLARSVLHALVGRTRRFVAAGPPRRRASSYLHGYVSIPLTPA